MKRATTYWFPAFLCVIYALLVVPAYGRGNPTQPTSPVVGSPYKSAAQPYWAEHSRITYGFQFGYAVENDIPHDISHINMFIAQPQIGIIVWNSPHTWLPVKRFEVMTEGIFGGSSHPGGDLIGSALFFRFGLKPLGRVVPFFDAGSGPLHTTIDRRASEITGNTQFLDQAGFGVQYFYKPGRAMVFEYRYFHMSNAGIQPPNPGFNGSMVTIGFCWLRRPHPLTLASHQSRVHFLHFW